MNEQSWKLMHVETIEKVRMLMKIRGNRVILSSVTSDHLQFDVEWSGIRVLQGIECYKKTDRLKSLEFIICHYHFR